MGLANRMGTSAHLIDFWNGRLRINLGRMDGRSSKVGLPGSSLRAQTYSPFSVWINFRASTETDWLLAKPMAAGLGFPFESKAACLEGPIFFVSTSLCFSETDSITRTRRLGVPRVLIPLKSIRLASNSFLARDSKSIKACGINPAGISSVPISKRSSFIFIGRGLCPFSVSGLQNQYSYLKLTF